NEANTTLTIFGTAIDQGGGKIAQTEISLDGGKTWHHATGTTSWSYTGSWQGATSILTRATDDSLNRENTGGASAALLDFTNYAAANPDVAAAGGSPLMHYLISGWKEGRDPNAAFDTDLYLLNNPDVKANGDDPLLHYLSHGETEGRKAYAA